MINFSSGALHVKMEDTEVQYIFKERSHVVDDSRTFIWKNVLNKKKIILIRGK